MVRFPSGSCVVAILAAANLCPGGAAGLDPKAFRPAGRSLRRKEPYLPKGDTVELSLTEVALHKHRFIVCIHPRVR